MPHCSLIKIVRAIFLRNEDEEEESAPLLQKKSSERIKQSMEENTVEERG